ncbi:MAG: hypothetical protein IPK26_09115 [Planctomycetes bacterium]|nr:hypothetical protein [Planctomycetota bacterium]
MRREQLDDLFKRLTPGPIPEGASEGAALVYCTWFARIVRWLAYKFAWQGKVFTRAPDGQSGTLVNRVGPTGIQAIQAQVYPTKSWIDDRPCIVLDYSKTSFLARRIRDEIRMIRPGLWLGKVWWGRTRLLDFALQFPVR